MKYIFKIFFVILMSSSAVAYADSGVMVFNTNWLNGFDKRIQYQAPEKSDISIANLGVDDLDKAVKISIRKDSNYTEVANGSPRAELSFSGVFRFSQGKKYSVSWETYIPINYLFDTKQPELISQIHQGPAAGYPPFALFISESGKYEVHNRTQSKTDWVTGFFGNPKQDLGRVVKWKLVYVPDGDGGSALTRLLKDGKLVFEIYGIPNSYKNDNGAYLKLGLYKADWLKAPSDVTERTIYYGALQVRLNDGE